MSSSTSSVVTSPILSSSAAPITAKAISMLSTTASLVTQTASTPPVRLGSLTKAMHTP
ncbi:hypothetical protein ACT3R9_12935 [Psychrobacter sp. AOP42-A1-21]|uniref:hypothetical protein n=1 Tax=Psychrobacter sp. AOP42-A1-21 TaxID=3457675 RepID=UPI0040353FB3